MARIKRARLHRRNNNAVVDDGDEFQRAGGRPLDVRGVTDQDANVRVHVSMFYRVNGVPFRKIIVANSPAVAAVANTPFVVQLANDFKPDFKVVHSLRVLAWDTNAPVTQAAPAKRHVVRVRVKSK